MFATSVIELFADPRRLEFLAEGALKSAVNHSIENMIERFAAGIEMALNSPGYRGGMEI